MKHLPIEILDDYAEGSLSPAERIAVEVHLANCAQCQGALVSLTQMTDLLREQPRTSPPADLATQIIHRLEPTLAPFVTQPKPTTAQPSLARAIWHGLAAALAWLMLIIMGGETVLAAYREGLADLIELIQTYPELLTKYPAEAFYALLESIPIIELGLTLIVLATALWLMLRFVALLPTWSRA